MGAIFLASEFIFNRLAVEGTSLPYPGFHPELFVFNRFAVVFNPLWLTVH
jgi:hypothetical protein